MSEMYDKVKAYIEKNFMLEGVGKVVVGLSGGADSVCLLLILQKYISETLSDDKPELVAVHVHHGIRGAEADSDALFCRKLCDNSEVKYEEYFYDVPRLAKEQGIGEEEMGRRLRYQVFNRNIEGLNAGEKGVVAVAHHQNDQAETVLFHIARGSSAAGAKGMQPVAGNIIRPLLCVSKSEIVNWLLDRNIPFCTDNTNFEDTYARNAIRLKVIPYLEEHVNGASVINICRYADRMAMIDDYIKKQTDMAYEKYVTAFISPNKDCPEAVDESSYQGQQVAPPKAIHIKKECLHIDKELLREHQVIINAVIYDALKSLCGAKDLEDKHVASCAELLKKQTGRSINLPKNIIAKRDYDGIVLYNMCNNNRNDTDEDNTESMILSSVIYRDMGREDDYVQLLQNIIDKNLMNDNCTKYFDYGKIENYIAENGDETGLVMRHRQKGDYMIIGYAEPEHSARRKKLKEIFIDSKIPSDSRDGVWLCAIGSRVLWAAGVRRCEEFLVDKDTKKLLRLELKQKEK